jgi:plastocyanin
MSNPPRPSIAIRRNTRGRAIALAAATFAATVCAGIVQSAQAQETTLNLTIHDTKFEPATLQVPAGAKIKLSVRNARSKPAEFESHELNREKVIAPGTTAVINIGPLSAGTYGFFDDFNKSTRGQIVAK